MFFIVAFYSTWLFLGSLYLIILTVQDYRSMEVDSKYNYILVGLGLGLILPSGVNTWYLLSLFAGMIFIDWYGPRVKLFASGDFSAFRWLFLGLGLINVFYLAYYIVMLCFLSVVYFFSRSILRRYGFKRVNGSYRFYRRVVYGVVSPVPFYPVILASWVLTVPLLIL